MRIMASRLASAVIPSSSHWSSLGTGLPVDRPSCPNAASVLSQSSLRDALVAADVGAELPRGLCEGAFHLLPVQVVCDAPRFFSFGLLSMLNDEKQYCVEDMTFRAQDRRRWCLASTDCCKMMERKCSKIRRWHTYLSPRTIVFKTFVERIGTSETWKLATSREHCVATSPVRAGMNHIGYHTLTHSIN